MDYRYRENSALQIIDYPRKSPFDSIPACKSPGTGNEGNADLRRVLKKPRAFEKTRGRNRKINLRVRR
jgi:hypothetical protein